MNTTKYTDMQRLRLAFDDFRAKGYWARMAQDNGWHAVPEDVIRRAGRVVFWHSTETRSAFAPNSNLKAPLHLRHLERDTEDIAETLREHGLKVVVDPGSMGGVVVMPGTLEEQEAGPMTGRRYVMMLGENTVNLIVASDTPHDVTLAASGGPANGMQLNLPVETFTRLQLEGALVPA